MSVLRELGAELWKMFAADLWLTLAAIGVVVAAGIGLQSGVLSQGAAPFVIAIGILAALAFGVLRGAWR